ncbi:Copper amine oxidase 1 [Sphaceloma murrayae]|uniref:Amine oxidase n=1 Tax=Sphaceloma murrayae TaxID=2082308 RepID=A0A2K1QJM8_9PEZI|nr:Copper amine oxidase 1 [Sphaceloma murrayae]
MKISLSESLLLLSTLSTAFARPSAKLEWRYHAKERAKKLLLKSGHLGRRADNSTISPPADNPCEGFNHITAPADNVWVGLRDDEAASVASWLFAQPELNLTATEDAGEWDNSVLLVELQAPNKTDVLSYIDGNGTAPTRYAHVLLSNRASTEPTYSDILVGPLPIVNGTTTWEPLEYPFTRKTGGQVRNLDADADTIRTEWVTKIASNISDITQALWGKSFTGGENDTIDIWGIDPLWQDDGRIVRWDTFWNVPEDDFDAQTLLPLGLYFKSDVTGRDPAQWQFQGWLYNDVFYETTDAFRAAFYSPGFERLAPNVEGDWARTDQEGPVLQYDDQSPPVMVAPSGPRYGVDVARKYVEWMDYSFYIGFTRDLGIALYDIKYKGQRILYELGLQEALAHYAANDPFQSATSYLDSYYGFGPYAFELVKGYDCPSYATYLNSSFYVSETTHTHLNSICLFEYDADFPMQRHSTGSYVSVRKNVYFTVRSVSTVGNYDYAFSYTFSQDGTIGMEVRASGYIQSTYYANNEDFGWQIQDALSGSMHDHVLNYKADFDVLGTDNSLLLMQQVPVSREFTWSPGRKRNTMQLQRRYVASENDSRLNWGANGDTEFIVVNRDMPNKYGSPRGYRILPSMGTAHLTVENSSNLVNAANWAGYDVQVTRQHDHEQRSAHPYNSQDVYDPPIDFNKYFDGESLDQEDLVVWLNLGMHHVPHTGDLPNTVFTTAHSGVQFMPLNYFDQDTGKQTVNQVRIEYGGGNASVVERFGQKAGDAQCAVLDYTPVAENLETYKGDVVIRKFPYSPDDPYYETDAIV